MSELTNKEPNPESWEWGWTPENFKDEIEEAFQSILNTDLESDINNNDIKKPKSIEKWCPNLSKQDQDKVKDIKDDLLREE